MPLVKNAGSLLEKGTAELIKMAYSLSILEAAIGMATINSLLKVDEKACFELNARDLIVKKGKDKRIAIVGHFPFVPKLLQIAKTLWVIEKNPREGDVNESEVENLNPQADIVTITGTAFTNHTIDHYLNYVPQGLCIFIG